MKEKKEKQDKEAIKGLTQDERKQILIEGIKKTAFPAFIGATFAFLFFLRFGEAKDVSWFSVILLVALVSYYIQRLTYPLLGVRVKEFGAKDWLYVEFLTMIFLMVVWTILLNE